MHVEVTAPVFRCSVCSREFASEQIANLCVEEHRKGYLLKVPRYKIGSYAMTKHFDDPNYPLEKTRIVRMRGEFTSLELLVESDNGERYWVKAVSYNSIYIDSETIDFRFVQLA